MTLSVCMIVRNESETLDRCLVHARPFVDEIVIVDTGSTDGTQEIAKRYADVFDEIEWPGSFAEARNYSMDLVTSDYMIILDGDEYLPDPEGWALIRRTLESGGVASLQLTVANVLRSDQLIGADRIIQDRVFRNHPLIRYNGKVHNQLESGLGRYLQQVGGTRSALPVEIVHTGYALSTDQMKRKYSPRIELLEAEYYNADSERYRAYYGYQLALAMFILERYETAHEIFGQLNYKVLSPDNGFYTHVLAAQIALRLADAERALIHCNEMLNLSRREPVAYYTTGLALILAGKPADGMLMMLGALDVADEFAGSIRFVLNHDVLIEKIADLYTRMGMASQARKLRDTLLTSGGSVSSDEMRALLQQLKYQIVVAEGAEAT
ncbi:MAG: glycosyltransferase family 2 protein [Rhodothermales bacterium]